MSTLVSTHRYNWMGYNGTESKEIDTVFIRGTEGSSVADYWHRRAIIEDIKRRFHLIKGDLDLIPEEELRAEREAARRNREAREAEEREKRPRQTEIDVTEYQLNLPEDEEKTASKIQLQERMTEILQRTAPISEEESNELLENMARSKEEVDRAVKFFSAGVRGFLVNQGVYYVSYLDGSWHTSLESLDQHNSRHRGPTLQELDESGVEIPLPDEYQTAHLHDAVDRLEMAQQKLQAHFCQKDEAHVMRLRKAYKDNKGQPITKLSVNDGREDDLRRKVEEAQADLVCLRNAYNKRAAVSGHRLASIIIHRN